MFLPGDDLVVGHEVGHLLGQALQLTVGGPATHRKGGQYSTNDKRNSLLFYIGRR